MLGASLEGQSYEYTRLCPCVYVVYHHRVSRNLQVDSSRDYGRRSLEGNSSAELSSTSSY